MSFLQYWKKPSSLLSGEQHDPFYSLQTEMNKLFSSFLTEPSSGKTIEKKVQWNPRVELKETKNEYLLTADLPGCSKEDVNISLHDDILSVKGERKVETSKDEEKYHFTERFYGAFERQIHMPENLIDKEKISAKFENGVLTVALAKANQNKIEPRKIEIK